jgi:hypothetical protein
VCAHDGLVDTNPVLKNLLAKMLKNPAVLPSYDRVESYEGFRILT